MIEVWRAVVFELAYSYWAGVCGNPSRAEYGTNYLRKAKK